LRRFARHGQAGGTAVNRLDRQPVLGEKQRMPADTAAEIERRAAPRALSSGNSAMTSGSG
jgi:hypothetical protein